MFNIIVLLNMTNPNTSSQYLGMLFQLIFLIVVFVIVIFLAYYSTKFIAGAKMKTMKNSNMKIIETISVGFNNLHILNINDKYYLISSSREGIKYLTELNKDDIIISDKNFNSKSLENNFKSYLEKFKSKSNLGGKNEK